MNDLATLIGTSIGGIIGIAVVCIVLYGVFFWPVLAFMAVRHLKHIRWQFELLNERIANNVTYTPMSAADREPFRSERDTHVRAR